MTYEVSERTTYAGHAAGPRDGLIVRAIDGFVSATLMGWGQHHRGARLLDVGCGNQPFRQRIETLGIVYSSCDVRGQSSAMPDFLCAIDDNLPADLQAQECFDFLLCTEVLEHVGNLPAAFANMNRLLRTGGRVLITVPFVFPLHEEPYDFWRPTPHALHRLAGEHGFKVLTLQKLGNSFAVLAQTCGPLLITPELNAGLIGLSGVRRFCRRVMNRIWRHALGVARQCFAWQSDRMPSDLEGACYLGHALILEKITDHKAGDR
jgi:SAM-dependent methyltransferase